VDAPIPRTEALELILARVQPLDAEVVAAASANGRVLADPATAAVDLPPFPSSAMDGYAVRAADTPGTLHVVGESVAGRPWAGTLGVGDAVVISTGAVVPEGASVVPVEETTRTGDDVEVTAANEGAHVRPPGGDAIAGSEIVAAGVRLGPAQLAALAAAGITHVSCGRRPLVAVLATGSELRRPGDRLEPGQIYEANTVLLAAQLESAGADVRVWPPVADDEHATEAALRQVLDADVVLTSGGVSMGEHDLVRPALRALGVDEVFWRVAVRPGKPVSFGTRGRTLVFGLPGNPVSSLVGFELFVRPAVLALQGARDPLPSFAAGLLGEARRRLPERDDLARARVRLDGDTVVLDLLSGQESHMIARSAAANALVLIERGEGELPAGSPVRYLQI